MSPTLIMSGLAAAGYLITKAEGAFEWDGNEFHEIKLMEINPRHAGKTTRARSFDWDHHEKEVSRLLAAGVPPLHSAGCSTKDDPNAQCDCYFR